MRRVLSSYAALLVWSMQLLVCCGLPAHPHLTVEVDSADGSQYVVSLDGKPWLHSGTLRLFVNGEWHGLVTTAPPTPTPICGPGKQGMDVAAGHVFDSFPNATDASCCASCQVHPRACNAWVRTTAPEEVGNGDRNPNQAVPINTCYLMGGARGYTPSAHRTAHVIDSSAPAIPQVTGTLTMASPPTAPVTGTDRFGTFSKVTVGWRATSSAGETAAFATSFRTYTDGRIVVLEQQISSGAKRTNHKNVTFADGKQGQLATTEPYPFLHFPSFNVSHSESIFATPGNAAFTTWQGTFVNLHGPFAGAPGSDDLGLSAGPVVVFDGLESSGSNHAVVIAPATHFKGATMLRWGDDWTVGLSGEITEVPVGFSHETIMVAGTGVTETMDHYGVLMRAAHTTRKVADRAVSKVGYWTDNGAYYYGDAYPQHNGVPGNMTDDFNLTCCTKTKLMAAKTALDADHVPIAYLQLDDWWYHGPHPALNPVGGVKCVSKWELPADTYPGGLRSLRSLYDAPFLLYGPYFCANNQWNQTLYPRGADAGVPPPEDSHAFYTKVFEYAHAHGAVGYEVDFMSNLFISVPEFRRTLDAATGWQSGLNTAALETTTPVQWCMMQPSDLLNSVQFDAVTNGRASMDYEDSANLFVGGASVLFWSMGLRPSKDNFWSGDGQKRQMGFSQGNPGTNGELNAIIATMSTGPVGPSDGAGQHNATRIFRTCAADGTILQPERPMMPIDAVYRQAVSSAERQLDAAAVWSTYSQSRLANIPVPQQHVPASTSPSTPTQYHVLGINVSSGIQLQKGNVSVAVFASDMYPAPPSGAMFAVRDWHRSADCTAGADAVATGCVRVTGGGKADPLIKLDKGVSWPFGTYTAQLYTATVLQPGGAFTLLGELDKFVPLSSNRFRNVTSSAAGLTATVAGLAGEVVHATALRPDGASWTVVHADVTVGADGTAQLAM